jgi:hypothetical protein
LAGIFFHGKFLNGQRSKTYSDGSMYVLQTIVVLPCSENKPTVDRYQETYRDGVWDGGEGIQKFTNGDTLEGVFNSTCSGEFMYTF